MNQDEGLFQDLPGPSAADLRRVQARTGKRLELRASDLESLLPEDHRARPVWGYVERQDLRAPYEALKARGAAPGRSAEPMWKRIVLGICSLGLVSAWAGPALTETETRWLNAGWPVLAYAKEQQLPVDVIVQPQAKAGDAPLAMGFIANRCKLVLSMRGNPEAERTLANIAPELLPAVVEAMVAHELGHCWRYVHGAWHTLPAGFVDVSEDQDADKNLARARRDMRETRREEGFADLVGLAWTLQRHPQQYAQVHAWFEKVRDDQPVPGSHHDTRAWIRLAKDGSIFAASGTPFEQVLGAWRQGLLSEN